MGEECAKYRVRVCSECTEDTEYLCKPCDSYLCCSCKEVHFKTTHLDGYIDREKPKQVYCGVHSGRVSKMFCETCNLAFCKQCIHFCMHEKQSLKTKYRKYKEKYKSVIHSIRSNALLNRQILLMDVKTNVKTCESYCYLYESELLEMANRVKDLIDDVLCGLDFKHRCLHQTKEITTRLAGIQTYEVLYELSAIKPVQFLLSAKNFQFIDNVIFHRSFVNLMLTLWVNANLFYSKELREALATVGKLRFSTNISHNEHNRHPGNMSITSLLNEEEVLMFFDRFKVKERGNRCSDNERVQQLGSYPEFHKYRKVSGVNSCYHISYVRMDQLWVSDNENNIIFTDKTDEVLCHVQNACNGYGVHTVNNESKLIYIDETYNIQKLSNDMKSTTIFTKTKAPTWKPRCLYWSVPSNNLLVIMQRENTKNTLEGKVTRFNQTGIEVNTIQNGKKELDLYKQPMYIIENRNEDFVVSDYENGVVVTRRDGKHRFTYTGHPPKVGIQPHGICTDKMSHILVCDGLIKTVHMLKWDGQLIHHLSIAQSVQHCSLSYDVNTNSILIGSYINNKVSVCKCISIQNALTAKHQTSANMIDSLSETKSKKTGQSDEKNESPLKLMSPPELVHSLTVPGVGRCLHISCVTSDKVWVSDRENDIILTNTTGVLLHNQKNVHRGLGVHAVSNGCKLIYIDRTHNIKLLEDMKPSTTSIELAEYRWEPQCVHVSTSTGDLLVGVYETNAFLGKVTRFNKCGQLTQTILLDNRKPNFVTENKNKDVVVSHSCAVVVRERRGRHRFSYTGHPSESVLWSRGICIDDLSHILVCDLWSDSVHMLKWDGQFLTYLLIRPEGIISPHSLSYDSNTQCLWVGSFINNNVCVYKYKTRQNDQRDKQHELTNQQELHQPLTVTDEHSATVDVVESFVPKTTNTEEPGRGKERPIKYVYCTKEYRYITLKDVRCCYHVSCVNSKSAWVSYRSNIRLTDIEGNTENSSINLYDGHGVHTLNRENELIYIENKTHDVRKLSYLSNTRLIKIDDLTWEPKCVYWAPSTGDLLVGMYKNDTRTGKVTRYNPNAQAIQTIQQDNKGLNLYSEPYYVTENTNGDVVISNSGAVVVTDRGGKHRFSYTGPPSGSELKPLGICTDVHSHILVCDHITKTVHIIDMDGKFLSTLMTKSLEIIKPCCLSYDVKSNFFWVGSFKSDNMCVFSYEEENLLCYGEES